jgi:hypothetical protein
MVVTKINIQKRYRHDFEQAMEIASVRFTLLAEKHDELEYELQTVSESSLFYLGELHQTTITKNELLNRM